MNEKVNVFCVLVWVLSIYHLFSYIFSSVESGSDESQGGGGGSN